MKKEIPKHDKDEFLANSALFLKEFKPQFIDYFTSLCLSYDCAIPKEETMEIAESIYENVFKCNFDIRDLRNDVFVKMRQDGVMIGFLINRSMFYLMENYVQFAKNKHISSQVEILLLCTNRFIKLFENEITSKVSSSVVQFDFSENEVTFSTNNIIDIFHKIKEDNQTVKFLNLYQGVPISCDAKVVEIDGENVSFSMDKLQEIAMRLDGHAYIVKNDYFRKHIKADIVYNNFITNSVVLNNFIYLLNMPAIQREFTRVHPDIVAKVYLHQFGDIQTSGRLYDLSISGLGVISSENNGIFVGAKVLVDFDLNSSSLKKKNKVEVEGEVVNIIEYKGSYRYCMRIFPEKGMDKKIVQYINQREKEIIENLKDELKEYIF